MNFRRGEDEDGVAGRLFERLQKRVERLVRKHVDFVHDIDLVPGLGWSEAYLVAQLADVVYAAIAGRVYLDQVQSATLEYGRGSGRTSCQALR